MEEKSFIYIVEGRKKMKKKIKKFSGQLYLLKSIKRYVMIKLPDISSFKKDLESEGGYND